MLAFCPFLFIFFSKFLKRAYKVNNKLNLLPEMTSFFFLLYSFVFKFGDVDSDSSSFKKKTCLLHIIDITEADNFIEAKNMGFYIYHLLFFFK